MLMLKRGRTRVDGVRSVVPLVRHRARKYGQVLDENALSVRSDWMICGANQAGKSRWLGRLHADAAGVWRGRPALYVRAINPLASWCEDARAVAWHAERGTVWAKLKVWERADALIQWAQAVHPVVLLDDAHLLTGRKLDVAVQLARAAGRVVTSCTAEGRIPISLRLLLQTREPVRVNLKSDAPFDATIYISWIIAMCALGAGAWQIAAAVGGLNMLARGGRSAKQS